MKLAAVLAMLAAAAAADAFIPPAYGPCPSYGEPSGVSRWTLSIVGVGLPEDYGQGPNGPAFYFYVRDARCIRATCRAAATGAEMSTSVSTRLTSLARVYVGGLAPGTEYACEVFDAVGDAEGPVFAFAFTSDPLPSPSPSPVPPPTPSPKKPVPVPVPRPGKPALKRVSATRVAARIEATKPARATAYRSVCRVEPSGATIPSATAPTKAGLTVSLRNLKPAKRYVCHILGVNARGAGPALTVHFSTKK